MTTASRRCEVPVCAMMGWEPLSNGSQHVFHHTAQCSVIAFIFIRYSSTPKHTKSGSNVRAVQLARVSCQACDHAPHILILRLARVHAW